MRGARAARAAYDVVVIGGGHAGCEAAAAAARTGARTALLTQRFDQVGELSCSPSIGGQGKSVVVREVDALDGLMARVTDASAIHVRMLNASKGRAVWNPRAVVDRDLYKAAMQDEISNYPNLSVVEATVEDLLVDDGDSVRGVRTAELGELEARAVVLATGTFLGATLHIGRERYAGGRHLRNSEQVEPPSNALAQTLARLQFPTIRLTTGTPPRLDGCTIDTSGLEPQPTDAEPTAFSYASSQGLAVPREQHVTCFITHTNERSHDVIRANADQLPVFSFNEGKGLGPRYCPALEKKVVRFPDNPSHQTILQWEGLHSDVVYASGFNTALPADAQLEMLRTIKGLEAVEMVRPGVAVEYVALVASQCLQPSLETRLVSGLYCAGQINGTTGYEEAAGQGLVAGANAGNAATGQRGPLVLSRADAFTGVMVDDLVTIEQVEPYRLFTSRAEYRLSLRQDNADLRLTALGAEAGVVSPARAAAAAEVAREVDAALAAFDGFRMSDARWAAAGFPVSKAGNVKSALEMLGHNGVELEAVLGVMGASLDGARAREQVQIAGTYRGHLARQAKEIAKFREGMELRIPDDVDYHALPSLRNEEKEKLSAARPATVYAASRISGVTADTLMALYKLAASRRTR